MISLFTTICQLSEKNLDIKNLNVITDGMSTIESLSEIEKCSNNQLNVNFINVGYSVPELYIQTLKSDIISYCSSAEFNCTFNNIISNSSETFNILDIIPDISVEQEPTFYFNLDSSILFEKDSCVINFDSIAYLNNIWFSIESTYYTKISIVGHSDNLGLITDRLPLSQCRATAVKDSAVTFGLVEHLINDIGVGDSQPIRSYDPNTLEGQQANRRVTIQVIKG